MKKRFTGKTGKIYQHLKNNGGITSMQAFELYGATRLSAIIFNLKKYGCRIETESMSAPDRYGNVCHFVKYYLVGESE